MALKRDTTDAVLYDALKLERHHVMQEIARLATRNFDRDIGRLMKKVAAIEKRMRILRETSLLALR